MSENQIPGRPQFDPRVVQLLDDIRKDVMHILSRGNPPADTNVTLGLQTLKVAADTLKIAADTMWRAVEKERLWAEKEKIEMYIQQLKAETEKIEAQNL